MVTIDDFAKLEFKVGTVLSAEEIAGSDRLLKLKVDFGPKPPASGVIASEVKQSDSTEELDSGIADAPQDGDKEETNDIRQILSGIKQWYNPEELVDKQFVFITNLAPRMMMGLESQGMIMAAEGEDRPVPLTVSKKVSNGAKIR